MCDEWLHVLWISKFTDQISNQCRTLIARLSKTSRATSVRYAGVNITGNPSNVIGWGNTYDHKLSSDGLATYIRCARPSHNSRTQRSCQVKEQSYVFHRALLPKSHYKHMTVATTSYGVYTMSTQVELDVQRKKIFEHVQNILRRVYAVFCRRMLKIVQWLWLLPQDFSVEFSIFLSCTCLSKGIGRMQKGTII